MADGYVSIDFSPIIRAVNNVGNAVQHVDNRVSALDNHMDSVDKELEAIKRELLDLKDQSVRQAALQRALTEIIRVRQELERDYGNYKLVRQTMLGILEATDLSLVRETTIATCTEELMLSTPKYWLAPVLIALAGWIADNRPLAERALKEALRRDDEKTSLTFALICRRNGRQQASFQWLARYFSKQNANDMKESIIAYIDAYTNGVFGEDRDNLCEEYIQHWMDELQQTNANFIEDQKKYWRGIYLSMCHDVKAQYPQLAQCAPDEFAKMDAYVERINASAGILSFFSNIMNAEVDQDELKIAIDKELIKLVTNYDEAEAPLREEEAYLTDIKDNNGDEKVAKMRRALRARNRLDNKVNLASRLSEAITSNGNQNISAKKTAIRFVGDFIKDAFKDFITEKADDYPEEVTLTTFGWSGKTKDGSNKKQLLDNYKAYIEGKRDEELKKVKPTAMIAFWCVAAVMLILTIVGFAVGGSLIALGVVGIIGTLAFLVLGAIFTNKLKKKKSAIIAEYAKQLETGTTTLDKAVQQLIAINGVALSFNAVQSCEKLLLTEAK